MSIESCIDASTMEAEEKAAIRTVLELSAKWGYGNMIAWIKTAWATMLVDAWRFDPATALKAADVSAYPLTPVVPQPQAQRKGGKMNLKLEIRRNSDNVVVTDVWPKWKWHQFWWEEGNASCDCNRGRFFHRIMSGEDLDHTECSEGGYSVRCSDNDTGELLYAEF